MTPPSARRDAVRNRALIVETARQAFSDTGLEVPLDTVAKAAGVGTGTLYRHFPTREDLVAAVLADSSVNLEQERQQILAAALDPTTALEQWLSALSQWMRAYDGLPAPLRAALEATGTPLGTTCTEVIAATDEFLTPLRDDGAIRPDLCARDLFVAILGLTWAAASNPQIDDGRLLDLLRAGWATAAPRPQ